MSARWLSKPPVFDHEVRGRRHRWRVKSDERGRFDEIVVVVGNETAKGRPESGLVLHAEMMNDRSCFLDVAGLCLWVHVGRDGVARISMVEDRRLCQPLSQHQLDALRDPKLDKPIRKGGSR